MSPRYAVVDLETTGGRASRHRITEIAIVLHDGERVLDTFETLVNPECYIPYGITELTGITQEMVQDAPKFYEVAKKVVEMTEGAIFVAHNVRFDYGFLKEEFRRLGYTFTRKQLCTVRLSRKAFPGLPSYSLGRLAAQLGIPITDRHRAMGDARATARILELILDRQAGAREAKEMIDLGLRESRLPKSFSLEKIHQLPESCGVYYFYNQQGDVIYVGKSINIKKRVAEHFAQPTEKARKLQENAHDLSWELTGSELIALLLESAEIKRLRPPVNRAQRQRRFPYVIHTSLDPAGYRQFAIAHTTARERKKLEVISEFPSLGRAKGRLKFVREEYGLCARLCGIQNGQGACFEFHLKQCAGACMGQEPSPAYNQRAEEAMERLRTVFDQDFLLVDHGRRPDEHALVLIEDGQYQGYGYIDKDDLNGDLQALRDAIRPYAGNPETTRIIQRYLHASKSCRMIPLNA